MSATLPSQRRTRRRLSRKILRSPLYSPNGRDRERSEPFYLTFFKTGTSIFLLCTVAYAVFILKISRRQHDTAVIYREHLVTKHVEEPLIQKDDGKVTTLPEFTLGPTSANDAFGIANNIHVKDGGIVPQKLLKFLNTARKLRTDFSNRYGGTVSARALLERSSIIMLKNETLLVSAMAQRIQEKAKGGVFRMAFGGHSAAAGHGNYFNQSYPFVVQRLLAEPFQHLGLTLHVRNAAVEHASAFPYTWCHDNFLGNDLDVASLDFGSIALPQMEALLRTMIVSQENPPILVFRHSMQSKERQSLLQSYVDAGALIDPLVIDVPSAIKPFHNVKESHLPPGFQKWSDFDAPLGAPGKVRMNLTRKQHELFGWLLSMQVLSAMELVARSMLEGSSIEGVVRSKPFLPAPVTAAMKNDDKSLSLLYGYPNDSKDEWTMGTKNCLTGFDPVVSGRLAESILSGTAGDDVDLLHPKGGMYYTKGWVLGLEPAERREKQLMRKWDNLGFVDYRKAYYGVPTSGVLSLFLPVGSDEASNARAVVKRLVVCESNASGGEDACDLERDVTFTVGGVKVTDVQWIRNDSVSHLGKRKCVLLEVPEETGLVSEGEVKSAIAKRKGIEKRRLRALTKKTGRRSGSSALGLALDIQVTNKLVTWRKGPCSVAHIVWELA